MATIGTRPARQDIDVDTGEKIDFTVPVLQANGTAVATLAGWTVAAQIRQTPLSATVLHTLTTTIQGTSVRVTTTGAQTAAWTWRSGQWDLVLTDPGGDDQVLLAGWVRVYPTTTR